jgi:hypothetical protein
MAFERFFPPLKMFLDFLQRFPFGFRREKHGGDEISHRSAGKHVEHCRVVGTWAEAVKFDEEKFTILINRCIFIDLLRCMPTCKQRSIHSSYITLQVALKRGSRLLHPFKKRQFIIRNSHRGCCRPLIQLPIKSLPRTPRKNNVSLARPILQYRRNQNLVA